MCQLFPLNHAIVSKQKGEMVKSCFIFTMTNFTESVILTPSDYSLKVHNLEIEITLSAHRKESVWNHVVLHQRLHVQTIWDM